MKKNVYNKFRLVNDRPGGKNTKFTRVQRIVNKLCTHVDNMSNYELRVIKEDLWNEVIINAVKKVENSEVFTFSNFKNNNRIIDDGKEIVSQLIITKDNKNYNIWCNGFTYNIVKYLIKEYIILMKSEDIEIRSLGASLLFEFIKNKSHKIEIKE